MSGSFSGHLLNSYNSHLQSRAPFGQPIHGLTTTGAMSFNSQMHGSFASYPSFIDPNSSVNTSMDISEDTARKMATLQAKLNKKLGPEYISQRPGPGGGMKLTYAEGWKIINLANEVFGFNGWSSSVVSLTTDYIDFSEESKRYCVGVSAIVRVTLRDGVYHEDVGYGALENSKSKGAALDKCKKEAVTDAVKRALRNFGNLLGNCLYDKQYTQEVVKIKVQPVKFDPELLHRRPEFDTSPPQAGPSTSKHASSPTMPSKTATNAYVPKPLGQGHSSAARPLDAIPPHLRPSAASTPLAKPSAMNNSNPVLKKEPATPNNVSTNRITGQTNTNHTPQQLNTTNTTRTATNSTSNSTSTSNGNQLLTKHASNAGSISLSDIDDPYHLASDDDAFFAAVDLGEGADLDALVGAGRAIGEGAEEPIVEDEGVGGAIDFEEGTMVLGEDVEESMQRSGETSVDRCSEVGQAQKRLANQGRMTPQNIGSNSGGMGNVRRTNGTSSSNQSYQPQSRVSGVTAPSNSNVNMGFSRPAVPPQHPKSTLHMTPSVTKTAVAVNTSNSNQSMTTNATGAQWSSGRASSAGGFNFPHKTDQNQGPNQPTPISRTSSLSSSAGGNQTSVSYGSTRPQAYGGHVAPVHAGTKRPVDMMSSPSLKNVPPFNAPNGMKTSMGQVRQPLAPLELDANAKRVRR